MTSKNISKKDEMHEFTLDNEKINELLDKLTQLKEDKSHIHLDINKHEHLLIHHLEDELE